MITVIDEKEINHVFDADYCNNDAGVLTAYNEHEVPVAAFNIGQWKKWFINAETIRQEE